MSLPDRPERCRGSPRRNRTVQVQDGGAAVDSARVAGYGRSMTTGDRFERGVAVVGAGYVGLPLATAFAAAGLRVVCIDADPIKVDAIRAGRSYIEDVPSAVLAGHVIAGRVTAQTDMAAAALRRRARCGTGRS